MHSCFLHPQADAAGKCEYCAQSHCVACLAEFLGRRYCPSCLGRVRTLAGQPAAMAAAAAPIIDRVGHPASVAYGPREDAPRIPGWASALLYLGLFVLVMLIADTLLVTVMTVVRLFSGKPVPMRGALTDPTGLGLPLWSGLFGVWAWFTFAAVLAATAACARLVERRGLLELGLQVRPTFWRDLFAGIGLASLLFISVVGVGAGKGWYSVDNRMPAVDALVVTLVGFLVLLPLAAVEEIAVRGYLMRALGRSWGRWAALLVSSAAFALLHGSNPGAWNHPLAMAGIFLAGLYLGSAYLITGNLWLPIFLHTGWNLLEGPVFGLPVSGMTPPVSVLQASDTGPALWTGGRFGPEAGLLLCLLMIVHLAALWVMKPALQPRSEPAEAAPEPAPVPVYRTA